MTVVTGTATDYIDLLDQLHTELVTAGWTIDSFTLGATVLDISDLVVTAPGSLGAQQPKFAIQTYNDSALNAYTWKITAYPVYDPTLLYGEQLNTSPDVHFCLHQNTIDYWFYINDTRLIVVAKIGVYYMSMYAGFFLPYALPTEYEFPYFVGATSRQPHEFNFDNSGMRSFCDPGLGAAWYMNRESFVWSQFANSYEGDNTIDTLSSWVTGAVIWPYRNPFSASTATGFLDMYSLFHFMRPVVGGKMPLFQCQIIDAAERAVVGILDGVFATGGFNRIPEQVITIGADDYKLFININRSTTKGFFAILEQ
jgi:hypothetical protein